MTKKTYSVIMKVMAWTMASILVAIALLICWFSVGYVVNEYITLHIITRGGFIFRVFVITLITVLLGPCSAILCDDICDGVDAEW